MYPLIKSGPGGFSHLSRVILVENSDGLMPAHIEGHEVNLPVKTQIQSLRMLGPLDEVTDVPAVGHPLCRFVAHFGCSRQL
jgi:hypothetical protein